jgi:hypothetical protein
MGAAPAASRRRRARPDYLVAGQARRHLHPSEEDDMNANCEVCGNEYDKAFEVVAAGAHHVFDSFECAIQALAPRCEHCSCRVIGHGVEEGGKFFCCAHCAHQGGAMRVRDRA